jgi:ElaA protein
VLISMHARGFGLGQELVAKAISIINEEFPNQSIKISAQQHLLRFYSAFGFESVSDPYDEDGIAHIEMLKV